MTTDVTIFHALFQGVIGTDEEGADLVALFSTEEKAEAHKKLLSDAHTELKKKRNTALRLHNLGHRSIKVPDVPDLYWDIRPVSFDPRTIEEALL